MTYTKQILRGSFIILFFVLLVGVLGYLIRLILIRKVSVEDYGLFYSVMSMIMLFSLFRDFGFNAALPKFVPEYLIKGENNKIKSVVVYTLLVNIICSSIICVVLYFCSGYLSVHYFKNPAAQGIINFLLIFFWLDAIVSIIKALLLGFKRSFFFSLVGFVFNFSLATILYVSSKDALKTFALAHVIASLIIIIIFYFIISSLFNFYKHSVIWDWDFFKQISYYCLPLLLSGVSYIVIGSTDTIILTYFSLKEVGIYNVVLPTATLILIVGKSLSSVLMPVVSEMWTKKMHSAIAEGINKMHKYVLLIFMPPALVLVAFPDLFLKMLFSQDYVSGSAALMILVIGMSINNIAMINCTVIDGMGKSKSSFKIIFIGAIANLILNLILVPVLYPFGLATVGSALASAIGFFVILLMSTNKLNEFIQIKIPWYDWFKITIASVMFLATASISKKLLEISVIQEAVISLGLAAIVYGIAVILMKLVNYKELKDWLKLFLKIDK